jgi:regulator of sigma E protease
MEWLSSLGTFGDILRGLIVLIEAIFVLNLLIVVHEWGHFLAARWRGLKIEKFYVWFGKPLWKKTFNGVEYGLGSIPLGGFVQLPQMGPMGGLEGEEDKADKLQRITPLDKIIVAFAGPLFSFLLAVVFAYLVFWIGMPDRRIHTTTIGWIAPDMPAAQAGFQPGDKILAIDGVAVHSWDEPVDSVKERIAFSKEDKIEFTVERAGQPAPLKISTGFKVESGTLLQRRGLRMVGVQWAYDSRVFEVRPGGAAERAGLKKGDLITQIDGKTLYGPNLLYQQFKNNPQASVALTVKRGDQTLNVTLAPLAPVKPEKVPDEFLGIALTGLLFEDPGNAKEMGIVHPLPSKQLADSSTAMFRTLGAVTGRKGDVGIQQMGGPVKIINTYTMLFQIPDGWRLVLWFSVLLNVNLAIMNLFPFPVFDGGHIVMAFGEWIRKGSLLPTKIMEGVQFACVALLLCFFVYVTWFDVNDLVGSGGKKDGPSFKIDELVYPAAK